MNTAQLLKELAASKRAKFRPDHCWQQFADMLRESEGVILSATSRGFTIPVPDGQFSVEFPGGLILEHWEYFSPLMDDWSKTLLAEGVMKNMVRPTNAREWDEALDAVLKVHDPNEEGWLSQLVEKIGIGAIATIMQQAIIEFRQTAPAPSPIVRQDSTGLWHSDDYRICKDKAGNSYNCTVVAAKLIEVLNRALKQGVPELNTDTLLKEAIKQSATAPLVAQELKHIHYQMVRLDHLFRRNGLWQTLVFSGVKKGCYKLVP